MNLTGRPISIAYAILLAGCAWHAWRQMEGMMFAFGEYVGPRGLLAPAFLIITAFSIVALAVAVLGFLDSMALLFPDRDTEPDWRPSDGLDLFQAIARRPHLAF